MEKSVLLVLCFIVVNVCLLSTFGAMAQDTQLGNENLWDEIWKNIRADEERMMENNPAAQKDLNNKIPEKRPDWLERLQNQLAMSPPHSTTAKPHITGNKVASPGVKANKEIDFKMVLGLLKQSGIELSNDQWMTLFQYVLSAKSIKSTASTTTITPTTENFSTPPLNEKTSTSSVAKETDDKKNEEEWLTELSEMLDTDVNHKRDQNGARIGTTKPPHSTGSTIIPGQEGLDKNGIISDQQWEDLLKRMMTSSDAKNDKSAQSTTPSSTRLPSASFSESSHQLSSSESVPLDKESVPISDQQWEALLERSFHGDANNIPVSESSPTDTPKQMLRNEDVARENDVIPDEEWKQVLQKMLDQNSESKRKHDTTGTKPSTTAKTSETQRDAVLSGTGNGKWIPSKTSETDEAIAGSHTSHKEWAINLQQQLDVNHRHKTKSGDVAGEHTQSTATSEPTTTEKSTTNYDDESYDVIGDRQWLRLLERAMDLENNNTHDSDPIGDRQWLQLLERVVGKDLLSKRNINLEQMIRKRFPVQTEVPTTQTVQAKESNRNVESRDWSDTEWDNVLLKAMNNHGHNRLESTPQYGSKSQHTTTPTTDTDTTDKDNMPISNDITADEQWEKLLNLETSADQEVTPEDTTTSRSDSLYEKTTPTASTEEKGLPKPQAPQALSSMEKIENDNLDNKKLYLVLAFGIGSGVLLMCLIMAVVVCRRKRMLCWASKGEKHTTVLNSDFNRWDPQTLRPSKENMNAFLYSIPMPMKEIKIDY